MPGWRAHTGHDPIDRSARTRLCPSPPPRCPESWRRQRHRRRPPRRVRHRADGVAVPGGRQHADRPGAAAVEGVRHRDVRRQRQGRVLLAGIAVAMTIAAAAVGVVTIRHPRIGAAAVGSLGVVGVVAALARPTSTPAAALPSRGRCRSSASSVLLGLRRSLVARPAGDDPAADEPAAARPSGAHSSSRPGRPASWRPRAAVWASCSAGPGRHRSPAWTCRCPSIRHPSAARWCRT